MAEVFIPVDKYQLSELLDAALGYPGCNNRARASIACEAMGYKLIKEVSRVWEPDKPEKNDDHYWLKGWMCEVEPLEKGVKK